MLPKRHPCVGAAFKVFETAVTNRQVETQDRGQLDIVHALVFSNLGPRVHLAIQYYPTVLPIGCQELADAAAIFKHGVHRCVLAICSTTSSQLCACGSSCRPS